ncbi:MAG: Holliday junction branch migration protein RuvA [Bacteroidetes bacterium]|nr:Holliday junction branch migration protein RuvA [Bacteroidota bacterium]
MFAFIQGNLVEKTPTYAVIDCHGVGYLLHISLSTYSKIPESGDCKLFVHQIVKEDAHLLYGFADQDERVIFRHLITVQGVGSNTARMILSSMSVSEVLKALSRGSAADFQSVKGIGAKTAQKIILELRDKVGKEDFQSEIFVHSNNTTGKEALNALIHLGFPKNQAEKAVNQIIKTTGESVALEDLIKSALKIL